MGLVGPWAVADYDEDFPDVAANTLYVELPRSRARGLRRRLRLGSHGVERQPERRRRLGLRRVRALGAEQAERGTSTSGTLPALMENAEGEARDELSARSRTSRRGSRCCRTRSSWATSRTGTSSTTTSSTTTCLAALHGGESIHGRAGGDGNRGERDLRLASDAAIEARRTTDASRWRRDRAGRPRRSRGRGRQRRFVTSVTLPALAFMAVFMVLPIVWALALSFFDFSPRRTGTPFLGLGADNPFVGLQHYREMFDFASDAP